MYICIRQNNIYYFKAEAPGGGSEYPVSTFCIGPESDDLLDLNQRLERYSGYLPASIGLPGLIFILHGNAGHNSRDPSSHVELDINALFIVDLCNVWGTV